jgi:hypothetical protein
MSLSLSCEGAEDLRTYSMSWTERTPKLGDPEPPGLRIPVAMNSVK